MNPMRRAAVLCLVLAAGRSTAAGPERISPSGDPTTATPLTAEHVCMIPFGRWVNGVNLTSVQHGVQFSAIVEQCATGGCLVTSEDPSRALVAKSDVADAIRFAIYDEGWVRTGPGAISENGLVAMPMSGPAGKREIWVLTPHEHTFRMRTRIPYDDASPAMVRWRDEDLYLLLGDGDDLNPYRVNLATHAITSATDWEPWCYRCVGGDPDHLAAGQVGDRPTKLAGLTNLELHSRSGRTAILELTTACRPMTSGGLATVVKVFVDCYGRIEMVSGLGEEIWCLRFSKEGDLLGSFQVGSGIAGDAKSVQVDERGRFYFLETKMKDDGMTPDSLRPQPERLGDQPPPVHRQERAGDVVGLEQEGHRGGDVGRRAVALERRFLHDLGRLGGVEILGHQDRTRADRVDPDPRRQRPGQALRHRDHARLRDAVGHVPGVGPQAGPVGDRDNRAAARLRLHQPARVDRAQEGALEVRVHGPVPVRRRHGLQGRLEEDRRVVDQPVERAERLRRGGDHRGDLGLVGQLGLERLRLHPEGAQVGRGSLRVRLRGVEVHAHVRLPARERERDLAPDPLRGEIGRAHV